MSNPGTHPGQVLEDLCATLEARKQAEPSSSYVAGLYAKGLDAILKKIAEEAGETVIAAKNADAKALTHELADLWFHTLVLMAQQSLPLSALTDELARRFGQSGLDEKAARKR
jgi:phosphoribosyl-ATP pyrophosphohydrolase